MRVSVIDLFSDFQLGGMGVAAVDFLNLWVISDCCCEGEGDEVYRGIVEAYHDVRACPPFPPLPPPSLFARLAPACSLPVSLSLRCSGIWTALTILLYMRVHWGLIDLRGSELTTTESTGG